MRRLLLLLAAVTVCSAQEYTGVDGSGPHMVQEPQEAIFNEDSNIQSVSLNCEAEGDTRPTYTWRRDGSPVDTESETRYQLSRGRLTISDPDRSVDAGTYQCFPSNQIGTIMSQKAELIFAYLDIFPEDGPTISPVPINSGRCISCDLQDHYPEAIVFWLHGGLPILQSQHYHIALNGELCFANFMEANAGEYQCAARNSINTGGALVNKFSASFSVAAESSDNGEHGPTVAVEVQDQEVLLNQKEVKLSCFFFGNPVPSIEWRRKSPEGAGMPALYELKSDNQFLVLKNIQVDDAGEYECYTVGEAASTSGMVSVKVPPSWVQELSDVNGNIYQSMELNCEAESPDGVEYKWYRNAVEITDHSGFLISNGLKTLTIQNLTVEDTGMYQCAAYNDYGEIYTTSQLIVLAIKPYFEKELKIDQSVPRGGQAIIVCSPIAAPPPTVQWTKGSQLISTDGHYTVLENGNLQIDDVVDSDGGDYTCTATNSQGSGASTGSIVVRDGTAIVQEPADMTVDEGQTDVLTCRASHDPYFDLQYVWMKDGLQVDLTSPHYEQPEINTGEVSELHIKDATLELAGEYTCTATTSIDDADASATVTVRGRPGAPAGISVQIKGLNANVSWSPGADNNSPILSYVIQSSTNHVPSWEDAETDIDAQLTHVRVLNLSPWSEYQFRVLAVNEVGRGEPSEESDAQETAQSRPTQAPSQIGGGGGNEGDLRITWQPLPMQEWNAPGLAYIVYWRQKDSGEDFQDATVTDEGTFTTSGVPAYTPFDVKIQTRNDRGDGPESNVHVVYSYQKRPEEAPTAVGGQSKHSTSMDVSWTGINAQEIVGELQGYKIKYWPEDSTEELAEIHTSVGSGTETVIEGLEPDTTYTIKVMAYSGGGDGPPNDETSTITTLKAAPQQAPAKVTVKAEGKNSMTVKWDAITTSADEEELTGYKVLYWAQGDFEADAMVKEVDKSTTQVTISGLKVGTNYLIKVRGYSAGGDGATSDPAQEVQIGKQNEKGEQGPRGSASGLTTTVLSALLPLLVAFHLR